MSSLSRKRFAQVVAASAITEMFAFTRSAAADVAEINMRIERATAAGALAPTACGLSYVKSELPKGTFSGASSQMIDLLRGLGKSILRLAPEASDGTAWDSSGTGSTAGKIARSDLRQLHAFLSASGWRALYGINLASNTPAVAASEAAAAAEILSDSLFGFEIGNECDLYGLNRTRPAPYTVKEFVAEWVDFAAAVRKVAPQVPLTGPASAVNVPEWTVPFADAVGDQISLLTQHYYRPARGGPATMDLLLTPDSKLPKTFKSLNAAAKRDRIPFGWRFTECNSYGNGGVRGVSDAFGSALWAIDFILLGSANGASGFNFHGGTNFPSYTPIVSSPQVVSVIKPVYYALRFVSQIAEGSMYPVEVSTSLNLTAYAIAGKDAALYLAVVNKSTSTDATATVDVGPGLIAATPLVLSGEGLGALVDTKLGGSSIGPDGRWMPPRNESIAIRNGTLAARIPAASAVLLKMT